MAMTRSFVFTNHKGGVGKSTSATNIALGMVNVLRRANASNCRVLIIDTDSQGHASLVTTGRKDYGADDSLYTVLMADRQNAPQTLLNCIVQSQWDENLHVLPASPMLEGAERELMGVAGAPYRLADPLSKIANQYAAIIIDTRPSFSLMTEMGLLAATDAIVPVEPRYLETVGLTSVIQKINEIREGWRHPNLRVSGLLVTKMDNRIRGHVHLLAELKAHPVLGKLLLGVIPANEAVSYAHRDHQSLFTYDPRASASKAYVQVVASLVRYLSQAGA
jgi:chromosome partitioning protein